MLTLATSNSSGQCFGVLLSIDVIDVFYVFIQVTFLRFLTFFF